MKFLIDVLSQLISNGLLTVITQIIVYPSIAKFCGGTEYGTILTILGIINTLGLSFGGALNNTVLVLENNSKVSYQKYNVLLIYILPFCLIIYLFSSIFQKIDFNISVFIIILLMCINNYLSVQFRIKLYYNKVLYSNLIQCIGMILGILIIAILRNFYLFPFFISQLLFLIYNLINTDILQEKSHNFKLNKKVTKTYMVLFFTTLIGNVIIYMDRSLIYPLLGAENVSVYTVASFFGKSASIVLGPISGVLLSYLSNGSIKINFKIYIKFILLILIFGSLFILLSSIIAYPITKILYYDLVTKTKSIMFLANCSAIIASLCNLINPLLLKKAPIRLQITIQIVFLLIYFFLGYFMILKYNILGFSIASLTANSLKLIIMVTVLSINLKKSEAI